MGTFGEFLSIENIITTQDDLYRSDVRRQAYPILAAKEVHNYVRALRSGFERVRATGLLTTNDIISIHSTTATAGPAGSSMSCTSSRKNSWAALSSTSPVT